MSRLSALVPACVVAFWLGAVSVWAQAEDEGWKSLPVAQRLAILESLKQARKPPPPLAPGWTAEIHVGLLDRVVVWRVVDNEAGVVCYVSDKGRGGISCVRQ